MNIKLKHKIGNKIKSLSIIGEVKVIAKKNNSQDYEHNGLSSSHE